MVFLEEELTAEAAVAFRAPVPVLVGLATVAVDEVDETLPRRSSCRVAGRDSGERIALEAAPARLAGRAACEGGRLLVVDGTPRVARARAPLAGPDMLAEVDLSGLEGFSGDMGRER